MGVPCKVDVEGRDGRTIGIKGDDGDETFVFGDEVGHGC